MAAGSGAASGHGARSSSTALEATLDRRFQGVSNTMESIQGLSNWCIENKKHHALIVRYWMKWLKKSDNNHRLNLFYLANDVIQNCKRKNAVVFRSAFGEVLSNAAQFIRDGKVRKSVERIFSIWEERSVYPEEVISQFKAGLNRKEKEREKPKEKEKDKEKQKVAQPANAQTNTKAALKSKIVAEFTPHSLVEQLSQYQRVVAEEELREKQLGSLRVDACSTEALKRLKDKAEGNKFAKDFEDNTEKLQEFVTFLDKELKTAPPLLEALGNADIFYEMQYKEVKIVANAYNAFANRVTSLKRKLDLLKPTLHGTEDSPIPSPSEDAPSPTGSDSPFLGLDVNSAQVDPELDGKAMDDGEMQSDTRDMEDMDVSDEDTGDKKKDKSFAAVAKATKVDAVPKTPTTPTKASKVTAAGACTPAPSTSGSTLASAQSTATAPLGVGLEKVDLGKISSILSSLTSAMKNTAASPAPSSTGTPTTPSGPSAASKVTPTSPALASILSRVDITPEGILNALSKSNTPGLSSLLQNVTNTSSVPPTKTSPESSSSSSSLSSSTSSVAATGVKTLLSPSTPKAKPLLSNSFKRDTPGRGLKNSDVDRCLSPPPPPPPPLPPRLSAPVVSPPSLESKINSFLQGNPGFSLALGEMSPDGVDGTPVRDEGAGTPTQDEMMDLPSTGGLPQGHSLSPTAYRSDPWDAVITPSGNSGSNGDFNGSSAAIRFGASGKNNIGKDDDSLRKGVPSPSSRDLKGRRDSEHGAARPIANRMSMVPRKTDSGGPQGEKAEDKRKGQEVGGEQNEGRYHRIETLVSPCAEGAPIQALKYSNRPVAGERIKTVESIRVVGRGSRREGGAGSRPSSALWFDEEAAAAYMEPQPPTPPRVLAPPLGEDGSGSGSGGPPPMPQPLPHLLLPPHLHPHPPLPPQGPFPPLPYHLESMPTPPPPLLLPHPPSSPFLSSPPPIPRPPPPPLPQQLSPSPVPSAVMVGGVLVPVDLPIAATRLDADRGRVAHRGGKAGPPPLMSSLLGEPPKLPRKGTVKEAFGPPHHHHHHHQNPPHQHHRHHHHRHPSPGGAGVPVPLLGRVKEPLTLPLPSPSPTSSTTPPSTPSSPALDATAAPPLLKPPSSPPAPPRSQPASGPVPLLDLPTPRPPFLSLPVPQRPLLRGRAPTGGRDFSHGSGFRGTKRSGPLFSGGAYHGQKRPYLPPRY